MVKMREGLAGAAAPASPLTPQAWGEPLEESAA
jgi:hypothetical protein